MARNSAINFSMREPLSPNPHSLLQTPPPRRISTVAGQRLDAVVSDRTTPSPSPSLSLSSRSPNLNRWSGSTNAGVALARLSHESAPPPYVWDPEPLPEEQKPEANDFALKKRGRRRRVGFLVVVACLAIGLGVGLGVGVSRAASHHAPSAQSSPETNAPAAPAFPLGEYSLVTALTDVETNCTSQAKTWRCYPGPTFDESPAQSLTTFNWILSNTSASYATNSTTLSTSSEGIAANMSVSSSDDPFSLVFDSVPLTFINDTSPRYAFTANMSQKVIPSSNITSGNSATVCFFNHTRVVGTLHLSDSFAQQYTYTGDNASYPLWPYAVDVELVSPGGDNTPACYYTTNGVVGQQVFDVLVPQSADDRCLCEYRNYL